jgi:hypothetical protein
MGFVHVMAILLLILGGACIIQVWRNRQDEEQRGSWIIRAVMSLALGTLFLPLPY